MTTPEALALILRVALACGAIVGAAAVFGAAVALWGRPWRKR